MEQAKSVKITDENVAMAKAEHFCAYQERSQQEVRDKLYEWGLWTDAVENIIIKLIEGNFLNEERFAYAYTRGKFNQKGWGKNKIKRGLKFKKVSDNLIKKALKQINEDDYLAMLIKIIEKKARLLTTRESFKRQYQLKQYALGRGYENDLITDVLKDRQL